MAFTHDIGVVAGERKPTVMADYRHIMSLLVRGYSYRQVEAMAGCSHRTIAKARQVLDAEGFTTDEQVKALTAEDLDRLFADGRKACPASSSRSMLRRWWRRGSAGRSRH